MKSLYITYRHLQEKKIGKIHWGKFHHCHIGRAFGTRFAIGCHFGRKRAPPAILADYPPLGGEIVFPTFGGLPRPKHKHSTKAAR